MILLTAVSGGGYTNIVYLLAAVFAGGLIPLLYRAWRDRKRGPIEDSQIIAGTVRDELGGLKDLLAEYRLEVELNKRQLEDYRNQLGMLTIELAKAQARISVLETQLHDAQGERSAMQRDLEAARQRRIELEAERERVRQDGEQLRRRIKELEDAAGITERLATVRREPPEPSKDP